MLFDKLKSTQEAIVTTKNLDSQQKNQEENARRIKSLDEQITLLRNRLDCIDSFYTYEVATVPMLDAEQKQEMLDALDACGSKLSEGNLSRDEVSGLKLSVGKLSNTITHSWSTIAPQYASEAKGTLAILGKLLPNGQAVTETMLSIDKALDSRDITPKVVQSLRDSVVKAKSLTSYITLDKNVEIFLEKMRQRQASLEDLTPEILAWFKENKLERKIRITF